jgi:hypothetical protein
MRVLSTPVLSALVLSAALRCPPAPVLAQEALSPMINVTGTGTVEAAPDIATLSIGVTTQGILLPTALAANSAALEAVLARLTAAGIAPSDMQTSNLSLNPNWTGYESNDPVISSYIASNQLTITIRKLDGLGAVLDASVADGANTLNGLTFAVADPKPPAGRGAQGGRGRCPRQGRPSGHRRRGQAGQDRVDHRNHGGRGPVPMYKAELSAAPVPVVGGEVGMSASITIFTRSSSKPLTLGGIRNSSAVLSLFRPTCPAGWRQSRRQGQKPNGAWTDQPVDRRCHHACRVCPGVAGAAGI